MLDQFKPLYTGDERQSLQFQFTGKGGEYFAIWIVNLLLTIMTFGIYSPWAKVRREQYFHRNTLLDGHAFDYTGQPIKILIGRVLVLIVIGVGSVLKNIDVKFALAVTAFFALSYPWVIVRSAKFRARNTRYRNIAFRFSGTTFQAVKAYALLYVALAPMMGFSLYVAAYQKLHGAKAVPPNLQWIMLSTMGASLVLFFVLWPLYQTKLQTFVHRNLHYGSAAGEFDGTAKDFFKAMLLIVGATLITIVAIALVIFFGGIVVAMVKGAMGPAGGIMVMVLVMLAYSLLLIPYAAVAAHTMNTTYAHAALGGLRFESDMETAPYAKLLFTNLLLLVVTFGIAWPWTRVRLMRYRIENSGVLAQSDALDQVVAAASGEPSAIGEEAAEFLDFDLSL